MTEEWKKEFFEKLQEELEKVTEDNLLAQNDNGVWYLKTMLAASEEEDDNVIVQAAVYQARKDVLLLELYVLLTPEIEPEAEAEVRVAMDELNAFMPIGALGISPRDRSIYLRDCFKLPTDVPMEETIRDAYVDYEMIMEEIIAAYPGLKRIWTGESTFAQVVEMGLLNKYSN